MSADRLNSDKSSTDAETGEKRIVFVNGEKLRLPDDIVPDGFVRKWNDTVDHGVGTIEEALTVAEEAPSTTDPADHRRCLFCGGTRLRFKPGDVEMDHKKPEDWKCTNSECEQHFDNPIPPRSEFDPRGAPRNEAGEPVCPRCGSWRLRSLVRGDVKCLDCDTESPRSVDASVYIDEGQATLTEVTDR